MLRVLGTTMVDLHYLLALGFHDWLAFKREGSIERVSLGVWKQRREKSELKILKEEKSIGIKENKVHKEKD